MRDRETERQRKRETERERESRETEGAEGEKREREKREREREKRERERERSIYRCLHKSVLGFTFEMLDADGDGEVTQNEYNAGFCILDSDGGGSLCRKEFGLKSLEHFDMLDVNRDGILTKVYYALRFTHLVVALRVTIAASSSCSNIRTHM
jgi:hypothetical protein